MYGGRFDFNRLQNGRFARLFTVRLKWALGGSVASWRRWVELSLKLASGANSQPFPVDSYPDLTANSCVIRLMRNRCTIKT